ncbi:hypothetical protein EIO_2975 (plasmid) [Ketogulonicigenium vulgare Y25]|uniref:Uncharacterized protein n=1 Tax=Ketogulonicigenium vulgare (strain WSH-001) TaxID=759362 RepID=F9YB18_KETVW|nr:hypothetical protein EIO_2975 [Ketogulonicigenium vulgare Y25]AEM42570.1 hypothetical protein KVU_PA0151 [Ketogulonicigenium vulgare WSH-001]ALJ82600.1 hypothetical protein KVH_14980 [Ketogulonicigenium vulgare]ANW35443.1 hypothetical protein KvSKV_14870 [Ketogulonicigenium vulgare]
MQSGSRVAFFTRILPWILAARRLYHGCPGPEIAARDRRPKC